MECCVTLPVSGTLKPIYKQMSTMYSLQPHEDSLGQSSYYSHNSNVVPLICKNISDSGRCHICQVCIGEITWSYKFLLVGFLGIYSHPSEIKPCFKTISHIFLNYLINPVNVKSG